MKKAPRSADPLRGTRGRRGKFPAGKFPAGKFPACAGRLNMCAPCAPCSGLRFPPGRARLAVASSSLPPSARPAAGRGRGARSCVRGVLRASSTGHRGPQPANPRAGQEQHRVPSLGIQGSQGWTGAPVRAEPSRAGAGFECAVPSGNSPAVQKTQSSSLTSRPSTAWTRRSSWPTATPSPPPVASRKATLAARRSST